MTFATKAFLAIVTQRGEKSENLKEQSLRHATACHLPLHKGGESDICDKSFSRRCMSS